MRWCSRRCSASLTFETVHIFTLIRHLVWNSSSSGTPTFSAADHVL
jgi:hypothetical protein